MARSVTVQASVVDLRSDNARPEDAFLVDTHVWFWTTYSKASILHPEAFRHQIVHYPNYINTVIAEKGILYRTGLSFAELAHIIEDTEFRLFTPGAGRKITRKSFRYDYPHQRKNVVAEIQASWAQVKTMSQSLSVTIDDAVTDECLNNFDARLLDPYDALAVQALMAHGGVQVITDDIDFATLSNVMVFTANPNLLTLASQQGKLVVR